MRCRSRADSRRKGGGFSGTQPAAGRAIFAKQRLRVVDRAAVVFLAGPGGGQLFADLGHFGRKPWRGQGLAHWQERRFIALTESTADTTDFYRLPPNRVVEMGRQLSI
jgi:K+ transporter